MEKESRYEKLIKATAHYLIEEKEDKDDFKNKTREERTDLVENKMKLYLDYDFFKHTGDFIESMKGEENE